MPGPHLVFDSFLLHLECTDLATVSLSPRDLHVSASSALGLQSYTDTPHFLCGCWWLWDKHFNNWTISPASKRFTFPFVTLKRKVEEVRLLLPWWTLEGEVTWNGNMLHGYLRLSCSCRFTSKQHLECFVWWTREYENKKAHWVIYKPQSITKN